MTQSTTATPALQHRGSIELPRSEAFTVRDRVALGTGFGAFTVTYVGPNFLRLFGDERVEAQPPRHVHHLRLAEWADDAALASSLPQDASLADLFAVLELGPDGPGAFVGESNTIYRAADGGRWTPHFYTRGNRLGFGALPFGDAVGWEPGDVFLAGAAS